MKPIKVVGLIFAIYFQMSCIVRNMPGQSPIKAPFNWFDEHVLTKLAFFHRGWAMFPSITYGAALNRVKYIYQNGEEIEDYFPLRSKFWPSVWNEVMEDVIARQDNSGSSDEFKFGYMKYQCQNRTSQESNKGEILQIDFEQAFVPLSQQFTNNGQPYSAPTYSVRYSFDCKNLIVLKDLGK